MIYLWRVYFVILGIVFIFAIISQLFFNEKKLNIFDLLILIVLIGFAGTRLSFNDTVNYVNSFKTQIPSSFSNISSMELELGSNPGFYIYQAFIKTYISENPQIFIFISSLITITSFVVFYKKYSSSFTLSIYLFMSSALLLFTMGAMKQVLAMAIVLWGIPYVVEKKYIRYIIIVLIASTMHPYSLIFLAAPLLCDNIWTLKTYILLAVVFIIGKYFESFVGFLINSTSEIGDEYSLEMLTGYGVNVFRLLVFSITPILSWIFRKKIRLENSRILNLSVNFSIISFLFMILASFGGANMFGRMGNYFEPFTYIALPFIVTKCFDENINKVMTMCMIICYLGFLYYQITIAKVYMYESVLMKWF